MTTDNALRRSATRTASAATTSEFETAPIRGSAPRLRGRLGARRLTGATRLRVMADVLRAVCGQIDYHWNAAIRPGVASLTDAEYLWEPAAGCWSLRPAGNGLVAYDFEWPPPHPPPLTTIAWRLFHIAVGCFAERSTRYFPRHVSKPWTQKVWEGPFDFPLDAAGAVGFLETAWREWRAGLDAIGEEGLWRPLGDAEGDISEMQLGTGDPFIGLVLHIHREVIHHGAEILLLRDLYRSTNAATT